MMTRRSTGIAWAVAAALLLLAPTANSMGGGGSEAAVVLDSVQFVDLNGGRKRIEILGGGFSNGAFPSVTLDGVIELKVQDASTTEISAIIPANAPDGGIIRGSSHR